MLECLNTLGITVPCKRVWTPEAAEETAAELGGPVWVSAGEGWRMRVENPADLSLAWAKAQKHLPRPDAGVLVQADAPGDRYRVIGYGRRGAFYPAEIMSERLLEGPFGVPVEFCVPSGLEAAAYDQLMDRAKRAEAALPHNGGFLETEFVVTPASARITAMHIADTPDPVVARLMHWVQGFDSAANAPQAAAVCWLASHSGVVEQIEGLEAAHAVPGVQDVAVRVHPGDILGHVTDLSSRDRLGHVLATGPTRHDALESARSAAARVRIVTRTTLD